MPGWQLNCRRPSSTSRRNVAAPPAAANMERHGVFGTTAVACRSWHHRRLGRSGSPCVVVGQVTGHGRHHSAIDAAAPGVATCLAEGQAAARGVPQRAASPYLFIYCYNFIYLLIWRSLGHYSCLLLPLFPPTCSTASDSCPSSACTLQHAGFQALGTQTCRAIAVAGLATRGILSAG